MNKWPAFLQHGKQLRATVDGAQAYDYNQALANMDTGDEQPHQAVRYIPLAVIALTALGGYIYERYRSAHPIVPQETASLMLDPAHDPSDDPIKGSTEE